ncbi:MAG: AAA family ATPase [Bacillota bacterium]
MHKDLIERIRKMAAYLEPGAIAEAVNLPVDVVRDVLEGRIEADEDGGDRAAPVKVVEKARFVRNQTVTAISPGGGTGKTTVLTSLALAAATRAPGGRPVILADLAEHARAAMLLGVPYRIEAFTVLDWSFQPASEAHPELDNLRIIAGVPTVDAHQRIAGDLASIIGSLQRQAELLLVDAPVAPEPRDAVLTAADTVLIVCPPHPVYLAGVVQLLPTLRRLDIEDKCLLVFNRVGCHGGLTPQACRQELRSYGDLIDGLEPMLDNFVVVPEEPRVWEHLGTRKWPVVLVEPDKPYVRAVVELLETHICPHWRKTEENTGGLGGLLKRFGFVGR